MSRETYLTFMLGEELFAVNVVNVLEVHEPQHITRVPKIPAHVLGIINFRGEILPVVNTRLKFGMAGGNIEDRHYIIIFELSKHGQHYTVAAVADKVKDVIEADPAEIKPLPEMGLGFDSSFVMGAIRRNDAFILMLNIDKVFSLADTEIASPAEITA